MMIYITNSKIKKKIKLRKPTPTNPKKFKKLIQVKTHKFKSKRLKNKKNK